VSDRDRYVPEQQPLDDRGRRLWGIRDTETDTLLTAGGEVDLYGTPDSARGGIRRQRYLDELGGPAR
jgi:hypothetical protein